MPVALCVSSTTKPTTAREISRCGGFLFGGWYDLERVLFAEKPTASPWDLRYSLGIAAGFCWEFISE